MALGYSYYILKYATLLYYRCAHQKIREGERKKVEEQRGVSKRFRENHLICTSKIALIK